MAIVFISAIMTLAVSLVLDDLVTDLMSKHLESDL